MSKDINKPDLTQDGKLPWFRRERRTDLTYREKLSNRFTFIAAFGALFVLIDPRLTVPLSEGVVLHLGGEGFSLDLKGLVVGAILIEGYKAIKEFWFGQTAAGQKTSEVVERMVESAPAVTKLATDKALDIALGASPAAPAVTPAPANPDTGIIPAAEVAQPKEKP